jgi:hypothetical protein
MDALSITKTDFGSGHFPQRWLEKPFNKILEDGRIS